MYCTLHINHNPADTAACRVGTSNADSLQSSSFGAGLILHSAAANLNDLHTNHKNTDFMHKEPRHNIKKKIIQ